MNDFRCFLLPIFKISKLIPLFPPIAVVHMHIHTPTGINNAFERVCIVIHTTSRDAFICNASLCNEIDFFSVFSLPLHCASHSLYKILSLFFGFQQEHRSFRPSQRGKIDFQLCVLYIRCTTSKPVAEEALSVGSRASTLNFCILLSFRQSCSS